MLKENKEYCDNCERKIKDYDYQKGWKLDPVKVETVKQVYHFCNKECYRKWRTSERSGVGSIIWDA